MGWVGEPLGVRGLHSFSKVVWFLAKGIQGPTNTGRDAGFTNLAGHKR